MASARSRLSFLATAVALLLVAECGLAQQTKCEEYKPVDGSLCNGLVDYPVLVDPSLPEGETQQRAQSQVAQQLGTLAAMAGPQCKKAAARYICGGVFVRCAEVKNPRGSGDIALPNYVSRDVCEDFTSACAVVLDLAKNILSPVNCALLPPGNTFSTTINTIPYTMPLNVMNITSWRNADVKLSTPGPVDLTMKCEKWNPTILGTDRLSISPCASILPLDRDIWTNDTLTLKTLVQRSNPILQQIIGAGTLKCKAAALKFICSSFFPTCVVDKARLALGSLNSLFGVPAAAPLPSRDHEIVLPLLTHRSLCDDFAFHCGPAVGDAKPDCSEKLGGIDRYPDTDSLTFPISPPAQGSSFVMQPNKMNSRLVQAVIGQVPASTCPTPLLYREPLPGLASTTPCNLPCPSPVFTDDQYNQISWVLLLFSIVGLVGAGFVFITYVTFKVKRAHPGDIIIYFSASSFMVNLATLLTGVQGVEITCHDEFTNATMSDPACGWQAFWMQFWALCTAFWWTSISFNLYLTVSHNVTDTRFMMKYYHTVSWGIPVLSAIPIIATEKYENAGTAWCFITTSDNSLYQWLCFYMWIGLCIAIGLFCLLSVVWKIYMISQMTGKGSMAQLKTQIRPIFFAFIIIYVFSAVLGYRISIAVKNDTYTADFGKYLTCRVAANAQGLDPDTVDCPRGEHPDWTLYFLAALHAVSQSLLIGIFYGLTEDNLWSWLGLCTSTTKGSSMKALKRKSSTRNLSNQSTSKPAPPPRAKPKPKPAPQPQASPAPERKPLPPPPVVREVERAPPPPEPSSSSSSSGAPFSPWRDWARNDEPLSSGSGDDRSVSPRRLVLDVDDDRGDRGDRDRGYDNYRGYNASSYENGYDRGYDDNRYRGY